MARCYRIGIVNGIARIISSSQKPLPRVRCLSVPGAFRYVLGGSSEVGGIASRIHSGECIARSIFPVIWISLKMILPSFALPGGVAVAGRVRKQVEICRW
jgi:hypothetical protein